MSELSDDQLLRYARHIVLDSIGVVGQQKLLQSSALIIGIGGLGSSSGLYLGASGVGRLILVDFDTVELSNLARQIAHYTSDIGKFKTQSAQAKISAINPDIVIETHNKVNEALLLELAQSVDIIVDGTDNFTSRFSINKVAIDAKKPLISASVIGFSGQLAVFKGHKKNRSCYRCLYDESGIDEDNCSTNGVLSPVVGILGTMQAVESIKVLLNFPTQLNEQLLLFDALTMQTKTLKLTKDKYCPQCND